MISTWFNVEQLHVELLGADPEQSISCTLLSLVMERVHLMIVTGPTPFCGGMT